MNDEPSPEVSQWLKHVRHLAEEIGPRGPTHEGERRGSLYCEQVLSDLGLSPIVEQFTSARSIFHPHLYAGIAFLLAFAVYPLSGRPTAIIAAVIAWLSLSSELLELSIRDNLLRRLIPKGPSQNVLAQVAPRGEHRQDVILIGHVDSQRTPIIFSSTNWLQVYKAFSTLAFILSTVMALSYTAGVIFLWPWIWPATIPSALFAFLLVLLCLQAESTAFTAGANDNATGAGLVLTLGDILSRDPLEHTRVWLVCTGCEEVQHYGAIDFFHRHKEDLKEPAVVVFESMGCAGPAWLEREGIIIPFDADPAMVSLAEEIAQEHPEWGAYPVAMSGGNTEMADALHAGIPAITICGIGRNGELPYWHQVEDTYDKMIPEVMERAFLYSSAYLSQIDRRASTS